MPKKSTERTRNRRKGRGDDGLIELAAVARLLQELEQSNPVSRGLLLPHGESREDPRLPWHAHDFRALAYSLVGRGAPGRRRSSYFRPQVCRPNLQAMWTMYAGVQPQSAIRSISVL